MKSLICKIWEAKPGIEARTNISADAESRVKAYSIGASRPRYTRPKSAKPGAKHLKTGFPNE